jgi:serine/threonine-protein kinase
MDFCPRDGARLSLPTDRTAAEPVPSLARKYRIIRPLGSGGMGTVFLAEQIGVGNRPVALKLLQRKLLDDPEFLTRFNVEASSTGRVRHPNVVTIYESGQEEDGTPYIAMEYLEGETLRQALQARGALIPAEAAEILLQAGRGLNAAHKLGIIHRDLKPDNIFLSRDDEGKLLVKVVDFGIAKLREISAHTATGTFLGTPAYMSFEQASGMRSNELDVRSDVYSLGAVAYEMLTGRAPFDSDTVLGFVRKHLTESPPPFHEVRPDLPGCPQLESVVMKALRKDRDQRYVSVLDFVHQFAQAATPSSVPAFSVPASRPGIPPMSGAGASSSAAELVPEAAGSDVAVQTPPPAPLPTPPATPTPELAVQSTGHPSGGTSVSRTPASRFRAPRGPSVHLEKYDKMFSDSAPPARKRRVRPVFLGLFIVVVAALWGLWHAARRKAEPPVLPSPTPVAALPAAGAATQSPQAPPPPDASSAEPWRDLAEQMKDQGLQQAQRALAELAKGIGEGPKIVFEPPSPKPWQRPLRPGDRIDAEYIDGGLRLEASPLPPALIARAAKGSKLIVQLDIESNGTIRKGRRLDGDKDAATTLIQAAKQTWRFSPPVANGVPVRTSAVVVAQF